MAWQLRKDESNKRTFSPQLWGSRQVRPHCRLVTIYTELRRNHTNLPYIFSLYSNAQCEEKQTGGSYLTNYIEFLALAQQIAYKEYIQLSRMTKIADVCVPFSTSLSLRRTSLPTIYSDVSSVSSIGWIVCCFQAFPVAQLSLSLRQDVCYSTPHKLPLQAENRHL